jgi:uncharacterized protein YoxC
MENAEQNGHSNPRMDRLEKLMDLLITDHLTFSDEHRKLLTAQVVLTDRVDKLADKVDKLAVSVQELRDAQKHTDEAQKQADERMSALIAIVDELIRNRPSQ